MLPHLILLDLTATASTADAAAAAQRRGDRHEPARLGRLLALLAVAHAGLGVLVVLASSLARTQRADAAAIQRLPVDPFARALIYYFALAPADRCDALSR